VEQLQDHHERAVLVFIAKAKPMTLSHFRHRADKRRQVLRRRTQRGVTLLFALITLVALLFATLALIRSVDTGTILLGNVGFKQDATATADQAAAAATRWLQANSAVLNTDSLAQSGLGQGYYASTKEIDPATGNALDPVDVTGQQISGASRQVVNWTDNSCTSATGYLCSLAVSGLAGTNSARYIIFRLCSLPGDPGTGYTGSCAALNTSTSSGAPKGDTSYGDQHLQPSALSPYFRVVVRVQGARNTTSFTETIVHL
jgi:type IV pilus assembly protein PilX